MPLKYGKQQKGIETQPQKKEITPTSVQDVGTTPIKAQKQATHRDLELLKRPYYCMNMTNGGITVGKRLFIRGKIYDIPVRLLEHPILRGKVPSLTGDTKWKELRVSKYDEIDDGEYLYSITEAKGVIPFATKVQTVGEALEVLRMYYTVCPDSASKVQELSKYIQGSPPSVLNNNGDIVVPEAYKEIKNKRVLRLLCEIDENQAKKRQEDIRQDEVIIEEPKKQELKVETKKQEPQVVAPDSLTGVLKGVEQEILTPLSQLPNLEGVIDALHSVRDAILALTQVVASKDFTPVVDVRVDGVGVAQTSPNTSRCYGDAYKNMMERIDEAVVFEVHKLKAKNKKPSKSGIFKQIFVIGGITKDTIVEDGKNLYNFRLTNTTEHSDMLEAIGVYANSDESALNFTGMNWEWYANEWSSHFGINTPDDFKNRFK